MISLLVRIRAFRVVSCVSFILIPRVGGPFAAVLFTFSEDT